MSLDFSFHVSHRLIVEFLKLLKCKEFTYNSCLRDIYFSFLVSLNPVLKFLNPVFNHLWFLVKSTIDELIVITFPNPSFLYCRSSSQVSSTPYSIPKDIEVISPYSMITEILCFNQSGTVSTNSCMSISAIEFPRRFYSFNNLSYLSRT